MEILLHRAEMTDCLGEVYAHTKHSEAEDSGDSPPTDEEFVRLIDEGNEAAGRVLNLLRSGELKFENLSPIEKFMVEDWLDGSTYFANMDDAIASGELTHQKASALRRAGESLLNKFREGGIHVNIPQL